MQLHIALLAILTTLGLTAAEPATNLLSIYLVSDNIFPQWEPGTMPKPESLKLISPPVLADLDFVSFDLKNQTFTITPDAAKRLASKIWAGGRGGTPYVHETGDYELIPFPTPFVLKAAGEPIYVGAFYTPFSSSSFAGPVIIPENLFIHTNLNNNVTLSIEPGYPGEFPGITNQLHDARITSAVKRLFAHPKH